jgi:hypothetical protein
MFQHPDAATVWETVNVARGGALEVVLMVETTLTLNPDNPGFDAARYNSLTTAIAEFIGASAHFDCAVIHPIPRNPNA